MTCIVGVKADDGIYVGGDSAGTNGWLQQTIVATSKVWTSGEFIYGFTTSFRMGDLLRYKFNPPKPFEGDDIRSYMAGRWMDAVRTCFTDNGFNATEDGRDKGGTFVVGYRGHLFSVQGDYSLLESADGLVAAGCGVDLALGALHASEGKKPRDRVRLALEAAERFSAGVARPFAIERLRTKEPS